MSCPICLESYTDPVVLPCGHSLCRGSCAKMVVKKARIKCPTCRAVHWAPEGVKGLPKNYALEEVIEENAKAEPLCQDHLDERLRLFCTQCYVPVCVKCCFGQVGSKVHTSKHTDHQVIPLDQMHSYVQGLLSVVESYLKSRRQQEYKHLESLMAEEEVMPNDHGGQQQEVTARLAHYDRLMSECREVAAVSEEQSTWTRLPELRLILQSLDNLSDSMTPNPDIARWSKNPPTDPYQVDKNSNKSFAAQGVPSAPRILLNECDVSLNQVSIVWTFNSSEDISYFTVYYETGIFTNGLCSDKTSIIVTEFGQHRGHVTLFDLDPETRYKVSVTASNDLGESLPSEYLYCRTSSHKPEKCLM